MNKLLGATETREISIFDVKVLLIVGIATVVHQLNSIGCESF